MSDEPINVLSGDLSKFFTNTTSGHYDYIANRNKLAFEERMYSEKTNKFSALCISGYNSTGPGLVGKVLDSISYSFGFNTFEKHSIKFRFYGDDEFRNGILSQDPLDASLTEEQKKTYVSLCRNAIVTEHNLIPEYGDIMVIRRNPEGKFFVEKVVGNINKPTAPNPLSAFGLGGGSGGVLQDLWNRLRGGGGLGGGVLGDIGDVTTEVSNGQEIKGGLNFSWTDLKELAALGIFEPVLKNIREHECSTAGCATRNFNGNQYDAFNYNNGNRIGKTSILPKPLSQYTVAEVSQYWQSKKVVNGHSMLATGAYQIIPKTMKSMIARVKGLDTSMLFSKENQDAMGVYLITMKRQNLGKYMFGDKISGATAGNDLAFEFASIRLQKAAKRGSITIPAYVRYYGGVGANKQGTPDIADTKKTMDAINQVRASIDNNKKAKQILERQKLRSKMSKFADDLKEKYSEAVEKAKTDGK